MLHPAALLWTYHRWHRGGSVLFHYFFEPSGGMHPCVPLSVFLISEFSRCIPHLLFGRTIVGILRVQAWPVGVLADIKGNFSAVDPLGLPVASLWPPYGLPVVASLWPPCGLLLPPSALLALLCLLSLA